MHLGLDEYTKVTFKKGSSVKFQNITLDINTNITELEHNKTNKYLGITPSEFINHKTRKDKRILKHRHI